MSEALRHLRRVDPVMAQLIRRAGPYAVKPERGTGAYEALVEAVAHQQLTGKAARTILGRFYALYGIDCCPPPARLVETPDEALRGCGFSRAKSASLKDIAARTLDGTIPPRRALSRMKNEVDHRAAHRGPRRRPLDRRDVPHVHARPAGCPARR